MPELFSSRGYATKPRRWPALLGMLIVTIVLSGMCWRYWLRMPDPLIDYGREIYVPWRLSFSGEVLYRDIQFFNGPLSAYVHAGLFRIAKPLGGATLQNIKLFNAIVTWAIAMLLYRLVRGLTDGDDIAATVAGISYVVLFALQQYGTANFNNITPYSYELPH